ncbi:mitochondrial substrate carrier family protein [Klebsormidium nitens]|uniref:Mitochondrial substrate carrier family protein n=1 Tax=Klebsormidium nitens TaxID=105231 RepID=A0A1Y1HSF0_KLENI|nr:mitochondrial substrate carrier family protein [Klebsormidium nitens]|eukprot:GAQ81564.1 mitochondrial substrate carrier family protein [Klebsormidium nitens]
MDNLPPLRKTAYPDRRKLSSVQEFYRYTEAEGRRLFEELDADRDGNVTLEDLEAAMRRRRLPQEYARKFLHKVRRGLFAKSFTWEEFSALMDEREPAILRAYNSLDLNSAGTLQRSQIKASLQRNGLPTTDRNINAMMRFLTGEADGQIAYGQFRNFLLLLPPERLRDHPSTVWFEAATVVPLYAPAVATGSVLKSALAGGLACAIPTFFLHPVDTMKTRVQASTMSLRDLVQQLPEIGARGLYRGAVPAIAGQFAGQGLRTGMLEASKAVLKNVAPDIPEMQVQSLASFTSTFMGTALRIPCEVIKQRCQAGLYDNWQAAAIGTYRSDGLPGFFRGTTATLLREVPFYVAGMMIYEQIKKGVRKGIRRELKPWETIAVGGFSGGLAAVTTTPFDVIKTRMMTAQPGVASSMGATFVHILKNEGVMALYKGALPRFFWIAPLGAMNFAGYELAKRAMEDQDRKQAREAEATAEAELRALEEAEANQRRSVFPQFSKLPDLREKLPRLRTVLSDLRTRVSKPRTSGQRSTVAGSVKGLVERIGGRNKRETETETVTDIETAGTGRITGRVGGSHEKGYVGGLEKEGSTQTLGKVELEEVRGETGLKGLVARIDKQRKGLNSVGGFTWPGKSKEGEGSEKGVTKESVNTVSGHKGEVPSKEGSGQPVKNASEEGVSERVGESVAATLRKSETEPAQREGEAPLAGSVGGASGRFGAAAGETGPASVPVEQRDRRGFLAGVPVPGIFKRPRKVGSNGNDRSAGTGSSRANLVTTDVQSANDAELEKDGSVSEGLIAAVQKKDDMEKK